MTASASSVCHHVTLGDSAMADSRCCYANRLTAYIYHFYRCNCNRASKVESKVDNEACLKMMVHFLNPLHHEKRTI